MKIHKLYYKYLVNDEVYKQIFTNVKKINTPNDEELKDSIRLKGFYVPYPERVYYIDIDHPNIKDSHNYNILVDAILSIERNKVLNNILS